MPVKHLLQPGSNNLSIQIHSAGAFAERQAAAYPYDVVRHGFTDRDAGTAYRRLVERHVGILQCTCLAYMEDVMLVGLRLYLLLPVSMSASSHQSCSLVQC